MSAVSGCEQKSGLLLPQGWKRAPFEFWRRDKLSALVFLVVNFFFGTAGIWLPLVETQPLEQGRLLKNLKACLRLVRSTCIHWSS